ncbi:hypothetical protein MBLNU459_g2157t1 [Dothideomycetes sp. NU459]
MAPRASHCGRQIVCGMGCAAASWCGGGRSGGLGIKKYTAAAAVQLGSAASHSAGSAFPDAEQLRRPAPNRNRNRNAICTRSSPQHPLESTRLRSNIHLHNGRVSLFRAAPVFSPAREPASTACPPARDEPSRHALSPLTRLLTGLHSVQFPGLYRRNAVPDWQRLHQQHDGVRSWNKGPRAKFMLYPYYGLMIATSSATMYMMCRMVLGHKTWFSQG